MHKGITLLVLGAIFCAMGIVFYTDVSNTPAVTVEGVALTDNVQSENAKIALESLNTEKLQEAVQAQNVKEVQALAAPSTPAKGAIYPSAQPQEQPKVAPSDRFISVAPTSSAPITPSVVPQEVAPLAAKEPLTQSVGQTNAIEKNVVVANNSSSETLEQAVASVAKIDESKLSRTAKHSLSDISLAKSTQGMVLRIRANSSFPVSTFSLKEPHRLVIDLPGTWQNMRIPEVPNGSFITSIRLGTHKTGPRLVLDLAKEVTFERSRPDGHSVDVLIR